MTNFAHTAAEHGADATTDLNIDDLEAGDGVMLHRNKAFEHREVAGFEDGILNQIVVLDDGTEVDQHNLCGGDGLPKYELYTPLKEN